MSETLTSAPQINQPEELPVNYFDFDIKGNDPLVSMQIDLAKDLKLKKGAYQR